MGTIVQALSKSLRQSDDPAFRRVLIRAILIAIVIFAIVWALAAVALGWLHGIAVDWLAAQDVGDFWRSVIEFLIGILSVGGILVASFLLFPAVMTMGIGFLLDDIAEAVEQRHYPGDRGTRSQPLLEIAGDALKLLLVTIGLNLLFLPLYLLLTFIPPLSLVLFYLLNGYLLGREYFELAAVRHVGSREARQLRKRNRGQVLLAGIAAAVMLTVPILNLISPIYATAMMVHLYQRLGRSPGARAEKGAVSPQRQKGDIIG